MMVAGSIIHNKSEVRALLEQIELEYQASQQGLSGLSEGSSRHEVIERRATRIAELHAELRKLVGNEAIALVARALDTDILGDVTRSVSSSPSQGETSVLPTEK